MKLYSKKYLQPQSDQWVIFIHGAGGSSNIWFRQIKEFKDHFNLILLDLRGHGQSIPQIERAKYTFDLIIEDIIELLNRNHIKQAHFVGISLGSMLSKLIAIKHPTRVSSLVLGGSIVKLNFKTQTLLKLGVIFKKTVPYMWLYRLFAKIILPRKSHNNSRNVFIKEAQRMDQNQFLKWFSLTGELPQVLRSIRESSLNKPILYIQGEQDHLFLKDLINTKKEGFLETIPSCGHIVNVERADIFNQLSIAFIREH
jgi:pimeloyl-ACP methyl ester carboxylesterase